LPVNAQVRVYRWTQVNGEEKLDLTNDVIASPPSISLKPNGTHVVRVVRVTKNPVATEESYRLVIDQLPNANQVRNGTINMIMRYSIPAFFNSASSTASAVAWSVAQSGSNLVVSARNTGDRRLRISALRLVDSKGSNLLDANGLVGYALAGATMRWTIPGRRKDFGVDGPVRISAQGDLSAIDATVPIQPRL
jgi:fimbrial chaperone protein